MGATQFRGYPRIDDGDPADVQSDVNALADAVDADMAAMVDGLRLVEVLHYTSNGTFQKGNYPGLKKVEVEVVGAGGGSGYAAATSGSQIAWGMGGAGGAYAYGMIDAADLASSETVTVGAAGTAGVSGTPDGGNGGNSSFGSHLTAGGGTGGSDQRVSTAAAGTITGGSGGAAGGTALQLGIEGEGDDAISYATGSFEHMGGLQGKRSGGPYGATAFNTQAPVTGGLSSQNAKAGLGIGSGARGPVILTSSSAVNGAVGATGRVIVRVYI